MSQPSSYDSRKMIQTVVALWIIIFFMVMQGIVALDLQHAESKFVDNFNQFYRQASNRIHINESILEGFAAMVSTAYDIDRTSIRGYARKMLKQYPHIFMFEIVDKVHHENLEDLIEYYRNNLYPDFEIKAFGYDTNRKWQSVKDSAFHLPIVFMEPFPKESRKILGLDLSSTEFLRKALEQSEQLDRSVASRPFMLVEGHLAYDLQRKVSPLKKYIQKHGFTSGAQNRFALLIIRTHTLLDNDMLTHSGMRVLLYHPSYPSSDPSGHLLMHDVQKPNWLESWLFPYLSMSKSLDSESQPFVLLIEQQLGWNVISWTKLIVTFLIASFTFAVVIIYARLYYRNEIERSKTTERLFYLANHDTLTGLANRNLLHDRLNHALSQASRQKGILAVLYMDLKKFKAVNDSYGHDIGDSVLKRAAERLRACVRTGDTLARVGGDEFVLVLENIKGREDVQHVIEKIKTGFEHPFNVGSHTIALGISIGSALFPDDAMEIDGLINHADSSMYADKRKANGVE